MTLGDGLVVSVGYRGVCFEFWAEWNLLKASDGKYVFAWQRLLDLECAPGHSLCGAHPFHNQS